MHYNLKLQRLGKARQPDSQKCVNRTIHPSWFDKRVGPIIGRNVGEIGYYRYQETETGGNSYFGNRDMEKKI